MNPRIVPVAARPAAESARPPFPRLVADGPDGQSESMKPDHPARSALRVEGGTLPC